MNKSKQISLLVLAAFLVGIAGSAPLFAEEKGNQNLVNINTAGSARLQTLPRVGETTARRIIQFREKNGRFQRIEDLMQVKGIGEKTFARLKDRITV